MSTPLTERIRSPTFSRPHRSAGLPSMIRPVKEGILLIDHFKHRHFYIKGSVGTKREHLSIKGNVWKSEA